MILNGDEIAMLIHTGMIHVEPHDPSLVNSTSLDVRLGKTLYRLRCLPDEGFNPYDDPQANYVQERARNTKQHHVKGLGGNQDYFVIEGGCFYLGQTLEQIGLQYIDWGVSGLPWELGKMHDRVGYHFQIVPSIVSRSTLVRCGLIVETAGTGNVGYTRYAGYATEWTLGMWVAAPIPRMFLAPGTPIAQIVFNIVTDSQRIYKDRACHYQEGVTPKPLTVHLPKVDDSEAPHDV